MNNRTTKVGFIGCGNMGGAIARAISKVSQTELYISEPNEAKAKAISQEIGCKIVGGNELSEGCDFVFLAIKPNLFRSVVPALRPSLEKGSAVLVTMAAGVEISRLEELAGNLPIIRIMPNTPVAVGKGMITWCKNSLVNEDAGEEFKRLFSEAGTLDFVDEKMIDAASAVSGCGPAFVYAFIEALADGGVQCGLPRDKAMLYAASTVLGAAEMVLKTGKHPGLLKDEVCSPGGSTIEGMHALESAGFRGISAEAVIAAYEKTKKLGK